MSKNGILTADIIHNDDDDDLVSAPNKYDKNIRIRRTELKFYYRYSYL